MTGRLGATLQLDGSCIFEAWAPLHGSLTLLLDGGKRSVPAVATADGMHCATVPNVPAGTRYQWQLNKDLVRPDPVSRSQPDGVHGASEVVDLAFPWKDHAFVAPAMADSVFYELHVGTFTKEGTLAAIIPRLPYLRSLGVTTLELLPLAHFPGSRNWGYDGVYPFAVHSAYGGPRALQQLVDAAHQQGLAVALDVVYNHLGPEGNYLRDFGPYFTDTYQTPWGQALNFDGKDNANVRRYFIENALQWTEHFHIDALRLDAVHAIFDRSAYPFLEELADRVHAHAARHGRTCHLVAESDLNDPRLVTHPDAGGMGLDSMWCDDLHHAVHVLISGEADGYYEDFASAEQLERAYARGAAYDGVYSPHRGRRHGRSFATVKPQHVVTSLQTHDQVGNRMKGDRLSTMVSADALRLGAAMVHLSPYVPLLFMGEEYGETAPFLYFISHLDADLVETVRAGRKKEFEHFKWAGEPPDPQAESTFTASRLGLSLPLTGAQAMMFAYYQQLLALRGQLPTAVGGINRPTPHSMVVERGGSNGSGAWFQLFHWGKTPATLHFAGRPGAYRCVLTSAATAWNGTQTSTPQWQQSDNGVSVAMPPMAAFVFEPVDG